MKTIDRDLIEGAEATPLLQFHPNPEMEEKIRSKKSTEQMLREKITPKKKQKEKVPMARQGGYVKSADGIAKRGKTKCKMV